MTCLPRASTMCFFSRFTCSWCLDAASSNSRTRSSKNVMTSRSDAACTVCHTPVPRHSPPHTHRVPPETAPTCAITRSLSSFALRTSASTSASRCTRKPLTRVAAASRWRMSSFSVFACVSCCSHCVQQPRYTTLHAQATTTTLVPHLLQRTTQSSDLTPRSMGT